MGRGAGGAVDLAVAGSPTIGAKLGENLHYVVHLDYDEERYCEEEGCSGICRCAEIVDARVESLSISSLVSSLNLNLDPASTWAVEQALADAGVAEIVQDDWEIDIVGGYYGQEIGSVRLISGAKKDLIADTITEILTLGSAKERVLHLLDRHGVKTAPFAKMDMAIEIVSDSDIRDCPDRSERSHYLTNTPSAVLKGGKGAKLDLIDGRDGLPVTDSRFRAIVFRSEGIPALRQEAKLDQAKKKGIPALSLLGQAAGPITLTVELSRSRWIPELWVRTDSRVVPAQHAGRLSVAIKAMAKAAYIDKVPGKGLGKLDEAIRQLNEAVKEESPKSRSRNHRIAIEISANGNYKLVLDKGEAISLSSTSERKAAKQALSTALS